MLTKRQRRVIRMNNVGTQNSDAIQMNDIVSNNTVKEGVSVCISAWKTAEYIEECLDSVAAQTWFKNHDNWEILLGIDGCEETLDKVKQIMHKYKNLKVMMMDKNVGTYVTCNTIMKEARYEWLLRFDSDDVMPNNMIAKIFSNDLTHADVIRYLTKNFGIKKNTSLGYGSHLIRKQVFFNFGGYRNWRIAADYDLIYRIEPSVRVKIMKNVYYNRRVRNNGLQYSKETGMKSDLRSNLHKFIENETRLAPKIDMVISEYKAISSNDNIVSFIIPNRGGTHLQDVIDNINMIFNEYEKEIIIITQCDDELFKKGQLYNIGIKKSCGKWVVMCDNDIINFEKIDLFGEYKKNGCKPYLGFTYITQIEILGENNYKRGEKKLNKIGAGAFLFGNKNDFLKVNGFSNLYKGWGCEDNEISCRLCNNNKTNPTLKHLPRELGHITHPKRRDDDIFKQNLNIFYNRKNRKIENDGIKQTTFDVISDIVTNGIRYIDVINIGVVDDFKYKNLL